MESNAADARQVNEMRDGRNSRQETLGDVQSGSLFYRCLLRRGQQVQFTLAVYHHEGLSFGIVRRCQGEAYNLYLLLAGSLH
jgi:hypothetical protein